MANTRFVLPTDNRTTTSSAIIKNGPGGPPVVQDPAYPMANLLNKDRYSVWATGVTLNDPVILHIDLGADHSIKLFGALGIRAAAGGYLPTGIIFGGRPAAFGYPPLPGSYPTDGIIIFAGLGADALLEIGLTPMRYLQYQFAMPLTGWGNGFSLGKVMASAAISDLGLVYSPGHERSVVTPQIRTRSQAGVPTVTATGAPYSRFLTPFKAISTATINKIAAVGGVTDPFVYLDQGDVAYECLPSGPEWARTHRWSPPDLWDVDFEFESLP